jgi:HlyD family secretion protein
MKTRLKIACGVGGVALIVVLAAIPACRHARRDQGSVLARFPAVKSDLDVTLVESGALKSAHPIVISSEINGKIMWLIPEGTTVKKGDKLIELENKEIVSQLDLAKQERENAQRALENAQREVKLQQLEAQKVTADSARALKTALMALEQYEKGKAPLLEQDLRLAMEKSASEYADSQEKAARMPMLLDKGFVTGAEVRAVELENREKGLAVKHKSRELEIFQQYDFPTEKGKLEAEVHNAQLAADRVAQETDTKRSQKEAEVLKQTSIVAREEAKYRTLDDQAGKLVVRAPNDGLVVYGAGDHVSYGNRFEVGGDVWQQQGVMQLPDLQDMVVEFTITEVDISQVAIDQRAITRIEGLGDRVFTGAVSRVAPTAQQDWNQEGKRYHATATLGDTAGTAFRPGMSAKVEVLVKHLENVVHIPIDTVMTKGAESYCYVEKDGSPAKRPITLGPSNKDRVVVTAGIEAGETVVLLSIDPEAATDPAHHG